MEVDCLKCINSACCKLIIEVDKDEYDEFWRLDLDEYFETKTDVFLKENPKYIKHIKKIDEMYEDNFATLKRREDGYCVLLDKDMKCTIYENRPKACRNYKQSRCVNIRDLQK